MPPLHSTADYLTKTANSAHRQQNPYSFCREVLQEDKHTTNLYRYASLNDGDTFWEMRRCTNVYLHKPREYSIAYYKPRLYGIAYCS